MNRTRTWNLAIAALAASLAWLLPALVVPADAGTAPGTHPRTPQVAFEGRPVDLRQGWGDARVCVVWDRSETDCYRTEQAADAAVARRERMQSSARTGFSTTSAQCGNWLYLYEYQGYGGRSLRFRDRWITQDLADWGFAYETSSYIVTSCAVTLWDAWGAVYPGPTGTWDRSSSMAAAWNNRVRYLRIH